MSEIQRHDTPEQRRFAITVWVVLGVTCLTSIAGFAWFQLHMLTGYEVKPLAFDSMQWRTTPAKFSHDSVRLRMVDDLLATRTLKGMEKSEITELVGPADDTPYFDEPRRMVYWLGQERAGLVSIDSEWLLIDFDEHGIATAAELARD